MSTPPKPGIGVSADTPTDSPEVKKQREPRRPPPAIESEAKFNDEQLVVIAQNMQLELAKLAFQHLDFSSASAVTAYGTVVDQIAKNAQTNIRNRQDAGANQAMVSAADRIAVMFASIDKNAKMPLVNSEADESIKPPELTDEDLGPMENKVPGNDTIGTEVLNPKDFIGKKSTEE